MNVLIYVSIRVVRCGLYEGSFQICDEDGNVLDKFSKGFPFQTINIASQQMSRELWGRFKENDHWVPVHMDADFEIHIPNCIRRKAAAAIQEAEQRGQLADPGRLETVEIDGGNLFTGEE